MTKQYTPRVGTLPFNVIAHLTEHGGTLSTGEIVDRFSAKATGVATQLRPSIKAGLLSVERTGPNRESTYSLAEPGTPQQGADEPLTIANWSDGDVVVGGGQLNENDTVTYTRKQIEQLVLHVTRPHVGAGMGASA